MAVGVRLLAGVAGAAVAVGPTLGFLLQARAIQQTGRVKGFSPWVCLLLCLAHILRIFFWSATPRAPPAAHVNRCD
jgi:hypothetical protein